MSIVKAFVKGLLKATGSPALLLWLWVINVAVALPAAAVMAGAIETSVGGSLVADNLRTGFDMGWYGEFKAQAKGLETTLRPSIIGAGAIYDNLEAWLTGEIFTGFRGLVGMGAVYAAVWALLLGGVLDRLSSGEGLLRLGPFFTAGGRFFFRFVRLAVIAGVFYYGVYRFAHWLLERIADWTRDVTVERTVLLDALAGFAVIALLLVFVNMAFDYAKIATFREDRKSMLLAALAGFRFVLRSPVKTFGLYLLLAAVGAVLVAVYAGVAPGAGQSTPLTIGLAFAVGQVYLLARLALRLAFYGGQMTLYDELTAKARAGEAAAAASPAGS